jgi:beta-N-acetylhexosaminidase
MRRRIGRRASLAVVLVGVLLVSVASPSSAAADHHGLRGKVTSLLRHMTLEEKVGQLFVVEVYGQDATTVSPAMAARNQALYGVDTPAQVIDKYKPGGIIYFCCSTGSTSA